MACRIRPSLTTQTILRVLLTAASLAGSFALADYTVHDEFTWADTKLDRAKWWRGGIDGLDGTSVILNESDLTSTLMFSEGDFKFVIGGHSPSAQGLFGLGDIDDGDPFLVLSDKCEGWRFHVRNGSQIHTGPVIASSLEKGDVVVFHWDSKGASVSINGSVKDSQTAVHPPSMPRTLLEWTGTAMVPDKASGRIVMDSVSYDATPVSSPKLSMAPLAASARTKLLNARLVEDTFVDGAIPDANCNGSTHQLYIRNNKHHPDLAGAGKTVDAGHLTLVQFALPPFPPGWKVKAARFAGVVAQNHKPYGMPGWAPGRTIELEVLGLDVNPDLATVTYHALRDGPGHQVIRGYSASGSANFTFGTQAHSLEVLRFDTSTKPVGAVLHFPDSDGKLGTFVQSKISGSESRVITLAIGPGRTQAVSGMECDFQFYARENTSGRAPMSLTLKLEATP